MKLKVLGILSPHGDGKHNCPGFLITDHKNKILLDCGSGTNSLFFNSYSIENSHIFITHLHEDHYSDIGTYQYTAFSHHNLKLLQKPIDIYLPSTPIDKCNKIINEKESFARYHLINESSDINIGEINISFLKNDHPIETYAIKVSDGNRSLVYTSDTSFSSKDRLVKFAKETDLLICESSLLEEHGFPKINSHLTAKQAGIIAKEANVRGLMLTHFWPKEVISKYVDEAKTVFPKTRAANEGFTIDFSEKEHIKEDIR